jgi:hypothetical protein
MQHRFQSLQPLQQLIERQVRRIQAETGRPGCQHLLPYFGVAAGRPQRSDDLELAHGILLQMLDLLMVVVEQKKYNRVFHRPLCHKIGSR